MYLHKNIPMSEFLFLTQVYLIPNLDNTAQRTIAKIEASDFKSKKDGKLYFAFVHVVLIGGIP